MAKQKTYERLAWEDRFNRPTVDGLKAGLPSGSTRLFGVARRHIIALDEVSETFAWHGDCWRWTIEFHTDYSEEPLAILVPSPSDLQVAVPMDREFLASLSTRRMKRSVRDGVGLAQEPFDTHWGVWSLQTDGILDDVVDLIELKLSHLAKRVG